MRAVVQRVSDARVVVVEAGEREQSEISGRIDRGLLVYLGVATADDDADARYLAEKVANLRIFEDNEGKMNLSVLDLGLPVLVVSQFTLLADVRKGRRPSWSGAAGNEHAKPLYEEFCSLLSGSGVPVQTGRFQATMRVSYTNEGPVTILLDSTKQF